MVFLKILPLIIIFLIPILSKMYLKSIFQKKVSKEESMIICSQCEMYVHESIIIKKKDQNYCSKGCASS